MDFNNSFACVGLDNQVSINSIQYSVSMNSPIANVRINR